MHDAQSLGTLVGGMMAGAAVYMVQEQLKAIGRQDRAEYLRKRLDPAKVAEAAFQRAGYSSFIPTFVDTGAIALGQKPIFDTRSSAQPSDLVFGNPASGGIDDILKATKGLVGPTIDGRPRTAEDTRNLIRPLIWQNALPVTVLMNFLTRGMPDRSPRQ
jgi:hypothetical protein